MSQLPVPDGLTDDFVRAFVEVSDERLSSIPVETCLVWDARHAPDEALWHVAEFLGMRRVLGGAALRAGLLHEGFALLGRRGTPAGVQAALEAMGFEVGLVTEVDHQVCDGSILADGEPNLCGADAHWAVCQVHVSTSDVVEVGGWKVRDLWATIYYFGRCAVRYVLTVHDASGSTTYREGSLAPVEVS